MATGGGLWVSGVLKEGPGGDDAVQINPRQHPCLRHEQPAGHTRGTGSWCVVLPSHGRGHAAMVLPGMTEPAEGALQHSSR
jgi:hypothetical protein